MWQRISCCKIIIDLRRLRWHSRRMVTVWCESSGAICSGMLCRRSGHHLWQYWLGFSWWFFFPEFKQEQQRALTALVASEIVRNYLITELYWNSTGILISLISKKKTLVIHGLIHSGKWVCRKEHRFPCSMNDNIKLWHVTCENYNL